MKAITVKQFYNLVNEIQKLMTQDEEAQALIDAENDDSITDAQQAEIDAIAEHAAKAKVQGADVVRAKLIHNAVYMNTHSIPRLSLDYGISPNEVLEIFYSQHALIKAESLPVANQQVNE